MATKGKSKKKAAAIPAENQKVRNTKSKGAFILSSSHSLDMPDFEDLESWKYMHLARPTSSDA